MNAEELLELMEVLLEEKWGDFALPCFGLAKLLRKSPKNIAEELKEGLEPMQEQQNAMSLP